MNSLENLSTAYDDVFRTLVNNCSKLVIPLINEAFGEHYTGNETIKFSPNEHFLNQQDGNEDKRITDSSFEIIGKTRKRYHLECESTVSQTILVRIFEYDAQIALDQDSEVVGNKIIVSFPNTAVLYLRSHKSTPDKMQVVIRTPGGEISYSVPVIKVKQYSIEEIFQKNLLFLIPFYIFTFESQLAEIESSEEKTEELLREYAKIVQRLEKLSESGSLDAFDERTIREMSVRVLAKIAEKYEQLQKEVSAVMVGKVLDYEAKRILDRGREEGREEGRAEARKEGIAAVVDIYRHEMNMNDDEITRKIAQRFNLDEEKAADYVKSLIIA